MAIYLDCTRFKNSSLVFGSSRNTPSIVEVTVLLLIFWTPRITIHMCLRKKIYFSYIKSLPIQNVNEATHRGISKYLHRMIQIRAITVLHWRLAHLYDWGYLRQKVGKRNKFRDTEVFLSNLKFTRFPAPFLINAKEIFSICSILTGKHYGSLYAYKVTLLHPLITQLWT